MLPTGAGIGDLRAGGAAAGGADRHRLAAHRAGGRPAGPRAFCWLARHRAELTPVAGTRAAALLDSCRPDTFVFLSPEQLANAETRQTLARAAPGLFVVDEAHLISQWGHDFRPDYMLLGAQAEAVGAPVRLALTATAAPPVRQEIAQRLGMREPQTVIGDFDRPNIFLSVRRARSVKEKQEHLVNAATEFEGAGIVYAATHADAQAAHDTLASAGERVTLYHAGLSGRARQDAMAAFLDGTARVIAATVAFGMGIATQASESSKGRKESRIWLKHSL